MKDIDDLAPLGINHIDDVLNGGGLHYAHKYLSFKDAEYAKKTKERFIEIGWKKNYINKKFKTLNDALMGEWSSDEFIVEYVKYIVEIIDTTDSISDNLKKLGLTAKVATYLGKIFSPFNDTCYTNEQLVIIAIEYQLGKNNPITPETTTHYFSPEIVEKWFREKNKIPEFINIPYKCSTTIYTYIDNIVNNKFSKNNSTLYFHSTYWDSCDSILERINNFRGKTCLDFGQEPGFYISPSIKDSLEWGEKMGSNNEENVIIIFSLPKQFPKKFNYKELVGEEWITVTKKSRRCKEKDSFIKEIANNYLLYGDMVANPKNVKKHGAEPKPHRIPKKQLVSKRDEVDDYIHKRIVGCLFFQKYFPINQIVG